MADMGKIRKLKRGIKFSISCGCGDKEHGKLVLLYDGDFLELYPERRKVKKDGKLGSYFCFYPQQTDEIFNFLKICIEDQKKKRGIK